MKELIKVKNLVEIARKIDTSELDWSMERLEYFTKELFNFSKFKIGDRVKLNETPIITKDISWGWIGYKEVLVKGAKATIIKIDHYAGTFRYDLEFDASKGGFFCFKEKDLQKVV